MEKNFFFKTMMAVFTIISLICLMRDFSYAQLMRMSVDDRVEQLTEQLTLTKAQADSVRIILKISEEERNKLFENLGDNRSAMRDSIQSIIKNSDAKIDSLLTDEQKAKFEKIKNDRPRMMGPRGERRRPLE